MAKGEWKKTARLIDASREILAAENPMTVRQLFYRLVSNETVQNNLADYQKVSKAMTRARKDGRVDWEWIVDRSRGSYSSEGWTDLRSMRAVMEDTLLDYRRDYWQDQPNHIEIWCEKDAVTGSIAEVRNEYGLTVYAIRGFNSTSNVHESSQRLCQALGAGKQPVILYLGDHDPSGRDIERDLKERLDVRRSHVEIHRVAIRKDDIAKFNLPPLRVKDEDPRARKFKAVHGAEAVELDALPPTELRARLRRSIDALIDWGIWERSRLVEEAQRETCQRYADALSGLDRV
jgi:hypothetical protein